MGHMRSIFTIMIVATLAAGCAAAPAEVGGEVRPAGTATPTTTPGQPRTIAKGLRVPWSIAFLDGGDALVTERDRARLLRVTAAGRVTSLGTIKGVQPDGEGGLMGVAVKGERVFLYYTAASDNRIVRYRLTGGRLSDAKVIVKGIPGGAIHDGGRLAFGPDGFLYATTGETGDGGLAQDRGSLGGKILRMTEDGAPAPGNPFGTLVYSYGHRNVQGLAWDPAGRLYASEFGSSSHDEVNLIKAGGNYGWPEVEGRGSDPGFINPIVTWRTSAASPSGMAYAKGSLWVGALQGKRLWQVPLGEDGSAGTPVARFKGTYGRLRAVTPAPDGTLWVGTSNHDGRGDPRPGDDRILSVPLS